MGVHFGCLLDLSLFVHHDLQIMAEVYCLHAASMILCINVHECIGAQACRVLDSIQHSQLPC